MTLPSDIALARRALPLMNSAQRNEATALMAQLGHPAAEETLEEFTRRASEAFEQTMAPVRGAIVAALKAGDMDALRGLRALLPHLLGEVAADPTLSDLLAYQLGHELLEGLMEKPEDASR